MISLFFVFLAAQVSYSQTGLSPVRPPLEDYKFVAQKTQFYRFESSSGLSVFKSRRPKAEISPLDWLKVPEVAPQELQDFFLQVRNERNLVDENLRSRRLPWMFPDSGCFARAEFMTSRMETQMGRAPYKIFAFGNLAAKTKFHRTGWVHWWYHVAPVVRVGMTVYVIDPSLDNEKPLLVEAWLGLMHAVPEISLCRPHSYDPNSDCEHAFGDQLERSRNDLGGFLKLEWSRVLELGLNPETQL